MGTLDGTRGYDELEGAAVTVEVEGMAIRLLALGELIAVKEAAGRDKDLAVLPVLRQTLAEKQRAEDGGGE